MATANVSTFLRQLTRGMAAETLREESDQQLVERLKQDIAFAQQAKLAGK